MRIAVVWQYPDIPNAEHLRCPPAAARAASARSGSNTSAETGSARFLILALAGTPFVSILFIAVRIFAGIVIQRRRGRAPAGAQLDHRRCCAESTLVIARPARPELIVRLKFRQQLRQLRQLDEIFRNHRGGQLPYLSADPLRHAVQRSVPLVSQFFRQPVGLELIVLRILHLPQKFVAAFRLEAADRREVAQSGEFLQPGRPFAPR